MNHFINDKKERIATLSVEDVMELHELLCDNYQLLPDMEPISPRGIKNEHLLHSAVSRQLVGSGDFYKYNTIYRNCATLIYGLVKNHSFHNGNKRMGFLALIKHLYVNGLVLRPGLSHEEIYELLRTLADNDLVSHSKKFYPKFYKSLGRLDEWDDVIEIDYIAYWLRQSSESKLSKVKQARISLGDLKAMLEKKGCTFEQTRTNIEISWRPNLLQSLLGKNPKHFKMRVPNGKFLTLNYIEHIRKEFDLSLNDGVDNVSFYDDENFLSQEIVSYKKIIYKLAKT